MIADPQPPGDPATTRRVTAVSLTIALVVILGTVLVVVGSAPATGQTTTGDGRITDVSYAGDVVTPDSNETTVWRSSDHQFAVTLESSDGLEDASVCVGWDDAPDEEPLACTSTSVPAGTPHEVSVAVSDWPANRTGAQDLRFSLSTPNESGAVVDEAVLSVTALDEDGDLDGDGLSNEREASLGADLRDADTDGDGLEDGPEVHAHGSSPTNVDTDNDGLTDGAEVDEHRTNPTAADTDDDGLQDPRELEVGANPNRADTDGDGLLDGPEVHTHETNVTNADTDGDGLNDGAEVEEANTNPTRSDTDGDGLTDNLEVATYGTDPTEVDTDGDGLEDGAEVDEHRTDPTVADTDGDGLDDGVEVNQFETDPTAADTDGDGLEDGAEVNRFETDPTTADTDGDGVLDPQEVERADRVPLSLLVGLVGIGLVASGGVLYWIRRRRRSGRRAALADRPGPDGADPARNHGERTTADVSREVLPNRERVLALLDERGGRIHQSEVVDETDWSKSKVSRVLSEMEADGEIAKISLGRENLVTRPDDRPAGSLSTHEE